MGGLRDEGRSLGVKATRGIEGPWKGTIISTSEPSVKLLYITFSVTDSDGNVATDPIGGSGARLSHEQRGITASHHNAQFDIDEDSLPLATHILTESALRYVT